MTPNSITPPKHRPALRVRSTPNALGLPGINLPPPLLIKRNRQRLGTRRRSLVVRGLLSRLARAPVLDIILACLSFAPRYDDDAFLFEGGDEFGPVADDDEACVVGLFGTGEHFGLDGGEESGDGCGEGGEFEWGFGGCVSSNGERAGFLEVERADFEADGDTLITKQD